MSLGTERTAGDPDCGRRAAGESRGEIANALKGARMVVIVAGMGAGAAAAPVVAEAARELGAFTIGIVSQPFFFEGMDRMRQAEQGIAELQKVCDSLIVLPNEALRLMAKEEIPSRNSFGAADEAMCRCITGICRPLTTPGMINLDPDDVRALLKDAGQARMGVGNAPLAQKNNAVRAAVSCPLLFADYSRARRVLLYINASPDASLEDIGQTACLITEMAHEDADTLWAFDFDKTLCDEIQVTVIGAGFDSD